MTTPPTEPEPIASAREQVADLLEAHLPGYRIDNYVRTPDSVRAGTPYIDVYVTRISGFKDMRIMHEVTVNVAVHHSDAATAEDMLETARDNVLALLSQNLPYLEIDEVNRVKLYDAYPGYEIKCVGGSADVYREYEVTL